MIFVATERVMPLSWDIKRGVLNADVLRWGLYTVAVYPVLWVGLTVDDDQVST
jgi:hypothetical protein